MSDDVFIPAIAILLPMFLVPTVMVLRQSARRREWRHRERMKAMELGVPIPGEEAWAARVAIAVGAIMPVGVFAIAWLASASTRNDEVWIAAALVGGAGVLGATRLAGRALDARPGAEPDTAAAIASRRGAGKPAFDPDAYDAIVRHG